MNYLKLQVEAQAAGLIRYDGKPCKKCSSTERYARNGNCASCTVATAKKWKESNSEKINEGRRRWRSENREYLSVWFKEYRKKKYAQVTVADKMKHAPVIMNKRQRKPLKKDE